MYTVTPTTMSLKCQGAPFALATRAALAAPSGVAVAGSSSAGPLTGLPTRAPKGAAAAAGGFRLARAVSTRPQVGHSPSPASSGAFQNLLQSSHHGKCAALHGDQATPKSMG